MQRLLTATEAGEVLGLSKWRVYELARKGLIPCVRVGERQLRFSEPALAAWVEAGGAHPAEAEPREGAA